MTAQTSRILVSLLLLLACAGSPGADRIVTSSDAISVDVSPRGNRIAIDLLGDIWTLPGRGGTATQLISSDALLQRPRWSPDGSRILYQSLAADGTSLWLADSGSGETARLGSGNRQDGSWHPDGERIVFAADRNDSGLDIWETDIQTGLAWRLTSHPEDETEPVWSANGRHLAWIRHYQDHDALMLRRRGEPDIALVESTARLAAPSWRPDGSLLTFQRQTDTGNTLEMVILSEPVLVRPIEVAEKLVTAPVSWRDRMHMLYTADGSIRTRGFEDRRSRPLNFRARVKAPEAPPPRQIVRRELEVADAPDGRLVIRAARLFDGIWKGYRENMDVVIEHGRIVAVEARRARDDGTVLDLGNVTVMPGLVDARSRLPGSLAAGTAVLAYGVTTIAVARSDPDYDPARWESETTPGPRLVFVDEPASPADFVSIADAATPGISGLLESRQAKAFHQIDRPPRRFSMPPDLTATAGPIIAVSQPNGLAPGIGLHAELRALQAAGLNGEQVLHAAGKNAAVVLGVENQVGTIIPGALADLLLVSGDPLDSVSAALNIVAIVRNGRFFSAVNLLERAASGAIVE